jgi:hypothetical protein
MNAAFVAPYDLFTVRMLTSVSPNVLVNEPKQHTDTAYAIVSHTRTEIVSFVK